MTEKEKLEHAINAKIGIKVGAVLGYDPHDLTSTPAMGKLVRDIVTRVLAQNKVLDRL